VDAGSGLHQSCEISITIRDLPPAHTIADAAAGDGSAGNPYTAAFHRGANSDARVHLATVSDPNAGQLVFLAGVNPTTGSFAFHIDGGFLTATPTGVLTSADVGAHAFDLQVNDGSNAVSISVSLEVHSLSITTGNPLLNAGVDRPYSVQLEADGASGEVVWSVIGGNLPSGIALDSSGTLRGRPMAEELASFTVRAQDASNQVATRMFSMNVAPASTSAIGARGSCAVVSGWSWVLVFFSLLCLALRVVRPARKF
jgi:hypothetical protein